MSNEVKKALAPIKEQVKALIEKNYDTVEQFCWDNDLNKATISNFLNDKKDFRVSTLVQIAEALDKKLIIKLD